MTRKRRSLDDRAWNHARATFRLLTLVAGGYRFDLDENVVEHFRCYLAQSWRRGYEAARRDAKHARGEV